MCLVCDREDRKEIDRVLLERAVMKRGLTAQLAAKIGCTRQVIWNHRKYCLEMDTRKSAWRDYRDMDLEEKGAVLGAEAHRLQAAVEAGMPEATFNRAMKALAMRVKLLELAGKLAGRLSGGAAMQKVITQRDLAGMLRDAKAAKAEESPDPEELARAQQEFDEVCGPEEVPVEVER
jgi:hypothetical protein